MLIYSLFKLRIVRPCLAIKTKAINRFVELLLRSLCIPYMKEKELSAFHGSNRKDAQYNKISFLCQKLVEFVCRIFIKLISNLWDEPVTLIMRSLFLTEMRYDVGKCNIKELRLY